MVATCGGQNGFDEVSSCLILDPMSGQWEENRMGPLIQSRSRHTAVTLNQYVYIIGGSVSSSPDQKTTEVLFAGNMTWERGPRLPARMAYGPCAVAISPTSFLVFYRRKIRKFDLSIAGPTSIQGWTNGRWPKLETNRRFWPGCAKVGEDKVIIAGGGFGDSYHQTTEILDLNTRELSKGGRMATPRRYFHIITFNDNGNITTLALGGDDNDFDELDTVEEWNPKTETWSAKESRLKVRRVGFGLVAAPKSLICPSQ